MTEEMLEIMMGKFLDGEITPGEQRLLDAELDKNAQAKELLGQLQQMHERCGEAVASELLGRGGAPDEIFHRAWEQRSGRPFASTVNIRGHIRFAVGLAAGLAIGLVLHFVLPILSSRPPEPPGPEVVARAPEDNGKLDQPAFPGFAGDAIRNVDWYNFTDNQGNKWIVEGLREDIVRPAVYYEGL